VLVNGRRIPGSMMVEQGDLLEVGSHRFLFEKAADRDILATQDDPLVHHTWRPSKDGDALPKTRPLQDGTSPESAAIADEESNDPVPNALPASAADDTSITEGQD